MPFGGNDWLALNREDTLEPELPICDPHHHFWDFRDIRIPYQRYLLHELAADVNSGHNVRSTVFIETRAMYRQDGPPELRSVGEVEFVQGLAAASASGLYGPCRAAAAIIGNADLKLGAAVEPVLDALQAASPNRFPGHTPGRRLGTRIPRWKIAPTRGCWLMPNSGKAPASWPARECHWKARCTSPNCPSWWISPTPCPT